jgi:hypothetical protein
MKKILFISVCLVGLFYNGISLEQNSEGDNGRIIVDNDKLQVVEFISSPGKSSCGPSMHEHKPHLTILLTDGAVKITTPDNKSRELELKSGTTLWSGADIHEAVNIGDNVMKLLLVYLK